MSDWSRYSFNRRWWQGFGLGSPSNLSNVDCQNEGVVFLFKLSVNHLDTYMYNIALYYHTLSMDRINEFELNKC